MERKVKHAMVCFENIWVTPLAIQTIIKRHKLKTDIRGNFHITSQMVDEARAIDDAARVRGARIPTQKELNDIKDWKPITIDEKDD